jgi:hypothetical protein
MASEVEHFFMCSLAIELLPLKNLCSFHLPISILDTDILGV